MEELKDRLKIALETRRMTAAELARQSGVDKGAISHYLKGEFTPKSEAVGKMARALDVSPAWLLGFDVNMKGELLQPKIELYKLSAENQTRILAYYQALLDTQEEDHGDT